MSDHPIEGLMKTAMESIKEMTDVNTVVGDAVEAPDGTVIIPISRVSCGFAAGGSEFAIYNDGGNKSHIYSDRGGEHHQSGGNGGNGGSSQLPFGGGSGAGMSVQPVGFLVVGHGQVRMMSVAGHNTYLERLVDMTPQVFDKIQSIVGEMKNGNGEKHEGKYTAGKEDFDSDKIQ